MAVSKIITKPRVVETFTFDEDSELSEAESNASKTSDVESGDDLEENISDDTKNVTKTNNVNNAHIKKKKTSHTGPNIQKVENINSRLDSSDEDSDSAEDLEEELDEKNKINKLGNVNSGLANVMAKILQSKNSSNVILSKAKKNVEMDSAPDNDESDFEVDSKGVVIKIKKEKKPLIKRKHESDFEKSKKKKLWENLWRIKPDVVNDREKERKLRILATMGVVQLLSAVEKHNNKLVGQLAEVRGFMQKEKILESAGKESFLNILRVEGEKAGIIRTKSLVKKEIKNEDTKDESGEDKTDKSTEKKKWKIFSENFYKEPTLDTWTKGDDSDHSIDL